MIECLELGAVKLRRPMTLFARFIRRPHVVNGCLDGSRITVRREREELSRTGQFGTSVRLRAMAHVTINTANSGVRRCMKRHKLGLHDAVASFPAKLDGLRVLVSAITAEGAGANKYERQRQNHECDAALAWVVQINFRIGCDC